MTDVEEKIAATVAGRLRHRSAIDQIRVAYDVLAGRLGDVRRLANDLVLEAHQHPERAENGAVARGLSDMLVGPDSLDALNGTLAAFETQLSAVHSRVHRDTINIGVLGRTKAGKSTILRGITGQGENVIPSSSDFPTTAARTRIHHSPDRQESVITLRTWEMFRDDYLAPLHAGAGLGPAPRTPDEFVAYRYPPTVNLDPGLAASGGSPDKVSAQPYLVKLNEAQRSFGSYRQLLLGDQRKITVSLDRLRPFVAYPLDRDDVSRPYHAVQDVHIYCPFRNVDRARVVLVDLPGTGEAGLEVGRHFLQDLNNDVDLLLCVKKPTSDTVLHGEDDFKILQLGQDAGQDLRLADFLVMVLNRDARLEESSFRNAVADVERTTVPQGISVLSCVATSEDSVQDEVFLPVLSHLAARLGDMDAAAVAGMRRRLTTVLTGVRNLLARFSTHLTEWRRALPDDEQELHGRAVELRQDLNLALMRLQDVYQQSMRSETPIQEIETAIATADRRVRDWAAQGFGRGSRADWETRAVAAMANEPFREYERQFNTARHEITGQFQHIDASLHAAVERLWRDVADVMREKFTEDLVPSGPEALARMLDSIAHLHVPAFRQAVERLVHLRKDYGSLFLRVASPIIVTVNYELWQSRPAVSAGIAAPAPPAAPAADGDKWWSFEPATPEPAAGRQVHRKQAVTYPAGSFPAMPEEHAKNLHTVLSEAIDDAVTELADSLRRESLSITKVLAATLWILTDGVGRTPNGEFEYVKIAGPYRTKIWPAVFDGSLATLTGKIGALDDGVRALSQAVDGLDAALTGAPIGRPR